MSVYDKVKNRKEFGTFLLTDSSQVDMFRLKSKFIRNIREYLHSKNAIELEMPCLQSYREGAPVHQFSTIHPLTDEKYYLRHCMGAHLRRVAPAFEHVFEVGKIFRVEVVDEYRENEFTILQYAKVDTSLNDGIIFIIELTKRVVEETFGTLSFNSIEFNNIRIVSFDDLMKDVLGFGIYQDDFHRHASKALQRHNILTNETTEDWEIYEELLKYYIEPSLIQPTVITNYPKALQHVTEFDDENRVSRRFSMIVNRIEVCDGGVKLKSSDKYRKIYNKNAQYKKNVMGIIDNDIPEDYYSDIDFSKASIFTSGFGIDRIFSICMGKTIQEVVLFPFK